MKEEDHRLWSFSSWKTMIEWRGDNFCELRRCTKWSSPYLEFGRILEMPDALELRKQLVAHWKRRRIEAQGPWPLFIVFLCAFRGPSKRRARKRERGKWLYSAAILSRISPWRKITRREESARFRNVCRINTRDAVWKRIEKEGMRQTAKHINARWKNAI